MDMISVSRIISAISAHYPYFKKFCMDEGGKISKSMVDEWYRVIGHLDFEEAMNRFDKFLQGGSKSAPTAMYFLQEPKKVEAFCQRPPRLYRVENGRLYDQDGYEYADPKNIYGIWSLDEMGRLCLDGIVQE